MAQATKNVYPFSIYLYSTKVSVSPTAIGGDMLIAGHVIQARYTIRSTLGQGGFGAVYLAHDNRLNREVALKATFDKSHHAIKQFESEAILLAHLRHPNLPTVSDHFSEGNEHYLVMDYIPGEDVGARLMRQGTLSENETLAIILPVLDALAYMHVQPEPVIHRDIKPGNIRIEPKHQIFLVDFGLAKTSSASGKTTVGAQAYTPGFSPLEQYGHGGTDARSDLYAVGATMYTMLGGYEPPEATERVVNDRLVPLRQINPTISPQVEQIIRRLLALHPHHRYTAAIAVTTDLLAIHSQKLCSYCGATNRASSRFCAGCGRSAALTSNAVVSPTVGTLMDSLLASPTMKVYTPGTSRRFDTMKESPARVITDSATMLAALFFLLPWLGFDTGEQLAPLALYSSGHGFHFEIMIAGLALLALLGLLGIRHRVAATRTALARWKLLLGITAFMPALDVVLADRLGDPSHHWEALFGAWLMIGAGLAIALGSASDIVGWRLLPAAFEPGYAYVIRTAHIITVGLITLCAVLTALGGNIPVQTLPVNLLLSVLVLIGMAASFLLPDRLPHSIYGVSGSGSY